MKQFFATLTIILFLVAAFGSANAQETEQEPEKGQTQQMPMMGGQSSMMGQMPMMGGQSGMMGQMPMMGGGMRCPMCGQMMSGSMMGGQSGMMGNMMGGQSGMMGNMMGGQSGMMGQMPMMSGMMGGQSGMMGQMRTANLPNAQTFLALADELKLADEQTQSLKRIAVNAQKETIRKRADLAIARLELNALLGGETVDIESVRQKVQQAANLEGELKMAQIQASIEAKAVLTAEQRAHFNELTKKPAPPEEKAEQPQSRPSGHEAHHQ